MCSKAFIILGGIMCADGFTNGKEVGERPDCGAPVDEEGDATYGCNYALIAV